MMLIFHFFVVFFWHWPVELDIIMWPAPSIIILVFKTRFSGWPIEQTDAHFPRYVVTTTLVKERNSRCLFSCPASERHYNWNVLFIKKRSRATSKFASNLFFILMLIRLQYLFWSRLSTPPMYLLFNWLDQRCADSISVTPWCNNIDTVIVIPNKSHTWSFISYIWWQQPRVFFFI